MNGKSEGTLPFGYSQFDVVTGGMKTDAPAMVFSQWPQECECRANHRPNVSDFHNASMNSKDWDTVLFLYRDGYYYGESDPGYNEAMENLTEVTVAKHTLAKPETIILHWEPEKLRITDAS